MKRRRYLATLRCVGLCGCLALATGACGFLFTHAPPDGWEQMDYFTCTEGNVGPILDVVWAGLNAAGFVLVASDPDSDENASAALAFHVIWVGVSGSAAFVGFNKTKKCRAAKQAHAQGRSTSAGGLIVDALGISPPADTLTVGDQVQLQATARNSTGGVIPSGTVTWSSSNDAIASVSPAGLVTAHASGSIVIAANADNVVGTANIVVRP